MKKLFLWLGVALAAGAAALALTLDVGSWARLDVKRITDADAATIMLDMRGEEACLLTGTTARLALGAEDIPKSVKNAFVAAEDARFYGHMGVDIKRIFGALAANLRTGEIREGASTITQQLIKLTHLTSEKTLARKANEAYLAILLERRMSKDEILTAYMNTVYFGEGAYGVECAARAYFGVSAGELTCAQAALLAGVLKAPSSYSPFDHPEKALARRAYVIERMLELGFIDASQAREANNEPLPEKSSARPKSVYGWYRDQVISEACAKLSISADELLNGGYTIYTCLDTRLQASADALFKDNSLFPANAPDGTPAQAAFCALDPADGSVRALVGGRGYEVMRGLNRATQAARQPGSAFKPISVYAAAIDGVKLAPTSLLDDSKREFEGGYAPANAGGKYYGIVTLRQALSKSLNSASVALIELTGADRAREYALRAGIPLEDEDRYLSLALGSLTRGVTPLELANAYAPLANGGNGCDAHLITRIDDKYGRAAYVFSARPARVMSAESAYMITSMLMTAVESGTAKALSGAGIEIAAKTGTVGEKGGGNRDIWTVAYTGNLVACAWMGFDEPDETRAIASWAGGGSYPAKLLAAYFKANADTARRGFDMPGGLTLASIDKAALTEYNQLLLATEHTPREHTLTEVFRRESAPKYFSSLFAAPAKVTRFGADEDERGLARFWFELPESGADYLVLIDTREGSEIVEIISGRAGEEREVRVSFPPGETSVNFTVVPRNRRMYEAGEALYGAPSEATAHASKNDLFMRIYELFGD